MRALIFLALLFLIYLAEPKIAVFCFHSIPEKVGDDPYALNQQRFLEFLDFLDKEGVVLIGPQESCNPFMKCAQLSFDDGYENHLNFVIPELVSRGKGAFFFWTGEFLTEQEDKIQKVWNQDLMILGAHGWSDESLLGQKNADLNELFEKSDLLIERVSGVESMHFAYPRGERDEDLVKAVRKTYQYEYLVNASYSFPWRFWRERDRLLVFGNHSQEVWREYLSGIALWERPWSWIAIVLLGFLIALFRIREQARNS